MMIKHKYEFLFFTSILKAIWNIFICTFILSIVLYGCAPKISEIRPISYNFEDQNKLKVAILTDLEMDTNIRRHSYSILPLTKKYNNINKLLINLFNKEKFKIELNPIKYVGNWKKKEYYIDAGKKLNVDYIIHIRFEETRTNLNINKTSYKIFYIHSGESIENHCITTKLDTNAVANKLFGFIDNFISQHDDYKIAKKPKKEHKKPKNKISAQVQPSKKNLQPNNKSLSTTTTRDTASDLSGIDFGRYFSLVIGNNNYQTLPKLKTAKNDAQVIAGTLKRSYGFNVELLIDATRSDILLALNKLRRKLTKRDNLLIYYAGHGWLDKEADEGYWLPTDAEEDNTVNWVTNSYITSTLRAIEAKHVLIVADSCYSGKLGRGLHIRNISPSYLDRISKKKARSVISSGGLEPVIDSGGEGRHSVFASVFLNVLRENTSVMDGTQLFLKIRRPVMLNADQTPEYSDIRKAGHQGGDFLFVRRK